MIYDSQYHWMVERRHGVHGWVCVFDNLFNKKHGKNSQRFEIYILLWQFIRDEIQLHPESESGDIKRFDRASLSSWCQNFNEKFKEHHYVPLDLPSVVNGLLGEDCESKIKQWRQPAKVERFAKRCEDLNILTNMPAILTRDTNLYASSSAHETMKAMKIYQDLQPITRETMRIAINKF